ncbi:MAG TPA: hypothetical protein CFH84_09410 [Sulfurimonas sp. UBA12504]|nr:MAG: hypothetical protein A2019_05935 [Sulfurimonas sp. GWF2_37_8]DAB29450.1 MAG TPA: hypothetical protein CFH84_09410 [Sulfurimonas sp. UBA12504]
MSKVEIKMEGATVPFLKEVVDAITYYTFDTSATPPPEPMINAMLGLQLLDTNSKLIMINHKSPGGLFPKIEAEFDYEVTDLEDGRVQVIFSIKQNAASTTDFSQNSCKG